MPEGSGPNGAPSVPRRSMWQKFFEDGKAECLECEAKGKVRKSQYPGESYYIITWKRKGSPRYAERWAFNSVPVLCEKCWYVNHRKQHIKCTPEDPCFEQRCESCKGGPGGT